MATIHRHHEGPVARLVIDNPATRNGLTHEAADALRGHLEVAAGDPAVRTIVLTGAGGHFCSGADLGAAAQIFQLSDEQAEALIRDRMHPVVAALAECPKPTVAVLRGACVGIGLSLALACDLRVAAEDASLGLVFTRIGLHPDGGSSYLLPRLVGTGKALELMLLGDRIDGTEAARIGLVNRAVPADELDAAAGAWIHRLAAGPPIAYRLLKANVRFAAEATLQQALDREAHTQIGCIRSGDALRGVTAFFAKEAPVFKGD